MHLHAPNKTKGFTLLEVVIAMTIVVVALMSLIELVGNYTGNTAYLQNKMVAQWVAKNRINENKLEATFPNVGETKGTVEMAGQQWNWTQKVTEAGIKGFRKVDVSVSLKGKKNSLTRLAYYASDAFKSCEWRSAGQVTCHKQKQRTGQKVKLNTSQLTTQ